MMDAVLDGEMADIFFMEAVENAVIKTCLEI